MNAYQEDVLNRFPKHIRSKYIVGAELIQRGKYKFMCPECHKVEYGDDEYPNACTGPHPSLHEHEITPMHLVGIEDSHTHPKLYVAGR